MSTLIVFSESTSHSLPPLQAAAQFLNLACERRSIEAFCDNPTIYSQQTLFFALDLSAITEASFRNKIKQGLKACSEATRLCFIEGIEEQADTSIKYRDFYLDFDDILFSPCKPTEVITRLQQFNLNKSNHREDLDRLFDEFSQFNLIGRSPVFLKSLHLIKKLSQSSAPVLIQGETGTGKENAARAIHYLSDRKNKAFIPVNCAALPNELIESELFGHEKGAFTDAKSNQVGLVEIANGGTLFLDEVDSLSSRAQTLLLRFLQNQEYRSVGGRTLKYSDVRIISASNANLDSRIEQQEFRNDLYYRLNVLTIQMPALRHRGSDIALLAQSFVKNLSLTQNIQEKKLTSASIKWLLRQDWPGNVRELENFIIRQLVLTEGENISLVNHSLTCDTDDELEFDSVRKKSADVEKCFQEAKADAIVEFEKQYLKSILKKAEGNISQAARISGKERRALGKLLKKYNIDRAQFEGQPSF